MIPDLFNLVYLALIGSILIKKEEEQTLALD